MESSNLRLLEDLGSGYTEQEGGVAEHKTEDFPAASSTGYQQSGDEFITTFDEFTPAAGGTATMAGGAAGSNLRLLEDMVPSAPEVPGEIAADPDAWVAQQQAGQDRRVAAASAIDSARQYSLDDVLEARRYVKQNPALEFGSTLRQLKQYRAFLGKASPDTLRNLNPAMLDMVLDAGRGIMARDDLDAFEKGMRAFTSFRLGYDRESGRVTYTPSEDGTDEWDVPAPDWKEQYGNYKQLWEQAISSGGVSWGPADRVVNTLRLGVDDVTGGLRQFSAALLDMGASSIESALARPNAGEGQLRMWNMQLDPETGKQLAGTMREWASGIRDVDKGISADTLRLPELGGLAGYANDVLRMVPQIALQMGTAIATGGSSLAGTLAMGAQIFGQTYGDLVAPGDGSVPVEEDTALMAALGNAIPQAILEKLSLDKALAVFKASGGWNILKAALGSSATELVTEFLQQYPDEISRMAARGVQEGKGGEEIVAGIGRQMGEITRSGLYQGLVAAPYGLFFGAMRGLQERHAHDDRTHGAQGVKVEVPGASLPETQPDAANDLLAGEAATAAAATVAGVTQRMRDVGEAGAYAQQLMQAARAMDSAALRQADPAAAADVAESLLQDTQRTSWIDGNDLMVALEQPEAPAQERQAAVQPAMPDRAKVLEALGVTGQQVSEAAETGTALPVRTAGIINLGPVPLRDAIIAAVRKAPTSLSAAEAELVNPAGNLQEAVENARLEAVRARPLAQEVRRIQKEMAAVSSPAVAKNYALLFSSWARSLESRTGRDAAETLSRLHFAGEGVTPSFERPARPAAQEAAAAVEAEMAAMPGPATPAPTREAAAAERAGLAGQEESVAAQVQAAEASGSPDMAALQAELARLRDERAARLRRDNDATLVVGTQKWPAHYEAREMEDVIASHDPLTFLKNPRYPEGAQERQYQSDQNEQAKVVEHAMRLDPALLLERGATATNGAPVIMADGVVLGGNSRTMSIILSYAKGTDAAARYKSELAGHAEDYGLDGTAVAGMRHPVLVRVLESAPQDLALASRQLNEGFTQEMDLVAEGVSQANRLDSEEGRKALSEFAAASVPYTTLREFLDSAGAKPFIQSLRDMGILQAEKSSRNETRSGGLTPQGKTFVEAVLRGYAMPDAALLNSLDGATLRKLDAMLPALVRLGAATRSIARKKGRAPYQEGWEKPLSALQAALRIVSEAKEAGETVEQYLMRVQMPGMRELYDEAREKRSVRVLALDLAHAPAAEMRARFGSLAASAEAAAKGAAMASMMPGMPVPAGVGTAFARSFLAPLAVRDGRPAYGFDANAGPEQAAMAWVAGHGGSYEEARAQLGELPEGQRPGKAVADEIRRGQGDAEYWPLHEKAAVIAGNGRELFQPVVRLEEGGSRAVSEFNTGPGGEHTVIRVFENADLSSIPHEFAHVALQEMLLAASDPTAGDARNALRRELEAAGVNPATLQAWIDGEATEGAMRKQLAAMKAQLKAARKNVLGRADEWAQQAREAVRQQAAQRRAAERYLGRLDSLKQVAADIRTLAAYAKVPEGSLQEMGGEAFVQLHEATARGFEQYLYEGKAPTGRLAGVFARLKRWLLRIYEDIRKYVGLDVTDDVRRVYDRMLATEKELSASRTAGALLGPEQEFTASAELADEDRAVLKEALDMARAAATAKRDRKLLAGREKRHKAAQEKAREEVMSRPVWNCWHIAGETGGLDRSEIAEAIGEEKAAELEALDRGQPSPFVAGEGGGHLQAWADEGWNGDVPAMMADIYDTLVARGETFEQEVGAATERIMAEEDEQLAAKEDAMVDEEKYADYLDRAERILAGKAAGRRGKAAASSVVPRRWYQQEAKRMLAGEKIRNLNPGRYSRALRKNLEARNRALAEGDMPSAIRAIQAARLDYELMGLSRRMAGDAAGIAKKARRYAAMKPGKMADLYVEGLGRLHRYYTLAKPRIVDDPVARRLAMPDLVQRAIGDAGEAVDILPTFADWAVNLQDPATGRPLTSDGPMDWRDLTLEQLEEVGQLQDALAHFGREQDLADKKAFAARAAAVAGEAAQRLRGLPDASVTPEDAILGNVRRVAKERIRTLFAEADSLQYQCAMADGFSERLSPGSEDGPVVKQVLRPILQSESRAKERMAGLMKKLEPHLQALQDAAARAEKAHGKYLSLTGRDGRPVRLPACLARAYGHSGWSMDNVIALAFNCGNSGNRERISGGYPDLPRETVAQLLGDDMANLIFPDEAVPQGPRAEGLFTLEEWKHIAAIGGVLNSLWPDTQETHAAMFGFKPKGIELGEVQVRVGDGTAVLPEWHYHIQYDRLASERGGQIGDEQDILARSDNISGNPSANRGFTMGRVRHTGLPLQLETSVLMAQLTDVVTFIEKAPAVRFADKVFRDQRLTDEFRRVFGVEEYRAIRPNLKGIVRRDPPANGILAELAEHARKYLVFWGLAWNIKVASMQATALFSGMNDIGVMPVLHGLRALVAGRTGIVHDIWEVSPYMKGRYRNLDQDFRQELATFDVKRRPRYLQVGRKRISWEDAVNFGMMPIVLVDQVSASAVWLGAYNRKLSELEGKPMLVKVDPAMQHHREAVEYADSVIKHANPDYDGSSQSAFLRDHRLFERMFNSFASACTLFAQRGRYMWTGWKKGRITTAQLARYEVMENMMPAVALFLLFGLVRGVFTGDDPEEEKLGKSGALLADMMFQQFNMKLPIFGSFASDLVTQWAGISTGGRRPELSNILTTPMRLLARAGTVTADTAKGEFDAEKAANAYGDLLSFMLRVPVSKVARNAYRGYGQWERGEGTPASIVMPSPGH